MRAPLSWLRDYAKLDADVDTLATTLSELGLVVEGIERIGEGLDDVVVSRVAAIRPHPNADKIRLVDVDAGGDETIQIVCGAWNFAEGDLVPLAPVGATLPGGFGITQRKMRGEVSNGMLCSARELGLGDDAGGLLILPAGVASPGTPLVKALELEPDVVFDLDVSPNRPDALCMAGVARDLAAALGEAWAPPAEPAAVAVDAVLGVAPITVDSGDLCPRFTGTVLEGVPDGPSPAWMARRLTLAGMRPISAVVDVSNYVMLDLGQPNHAYDLERLGGEGILVRRGKPGETLETLDGVTRALTGEDCVICDASGSAVGVGGIMGGAHAEIGPSTRRVLLEAAWFSPMAVARTGKRLGLHSEARVRFERGVDPEVAGAAVERFVALLAAVDGGGALRRGPTVDVRDRECMPVPPKVRVRTDRVNAILGTEISHDEVAGLIGPIGFSAVSVDGAHDVAIPSWRLDCTREIDVIEEVGRMWGYRRIARTLPAGARASAGLTPFQRERRRVRAALVGAGFDEAWTTTFLAPGDLERAGFAPDAVEVENPLDRSESILRTALLPGLLKAVKFNVDRQAANVCLFEIGRVFSLPSGGQVTPDESETLGVIVASGGSAGGTEAEGSAPAAAAVRSWVWLSDALRLQGWSLHAGDLPAFHPTRGARVVGSSGAALGAVGEVDPEVVKAYELGGRIGYLAVSLERLFDEPRRDGKAHDPSRYPAADMDLAFSVPEAVPAADVRATLVDVGGSLLESVTLFDVYRGAQSGAGRRSLAFRLRYRSAERTLGDAELAAARQAAIDAVVETHGAELRG